MASDTMVVIDPIWVMYVAGDSKQPIVQQAPAAFEELESKLDSLKGRKFYGIIVGPEYRAAVAIDREKEDSALPFPLWTIPGGTYVRRKIRDWEAHIDLIGKTFDELCRRSDYDPSRPLVEYYRSQRELLVMVPVK